MPSTYSTAFLSSSKYLRTLSIFSPPMRVLFKLNYVKQVLTSTTLVHTSGRLCLRCNKLVMCTSLVLLLCSQQQCAHFPIPADTPCEKDPLSSSTTPSQPEAQGHWSNHFQSIPVCCHCYPHLPGSYTQNQNLNHSAPFTLAQIKSMT